MDRATSPLQGSFLFFLRAMVRLGSGPRVPLSPQDLPLPSKPTPARTQELAAIEAVVAPVLRAHKVEAVEMTMQPERGGWTLRLLIELPDAVPPGSGVTIDLCTDVSRDVSRALDVAEVIQRAYTLEVSSPGVERPLRSMREFERFKGFLVSVRLHEPASDGQVVLRGRIAQAQGEEIVLELGAREVRISFSQVSSAHLVLEDTAMPRKGERGKKADRASKRGAATQRSTNEPPTKTTADGEQGKEVPP